jgi:hypothetical protein
MTPNTLTRMRHHTITIIATTVITSLTTTIKFTFIYY